MRWQKHLKSNVKAAEEERRTALLPWLVELYFQIVEARPFRQLIVHTEGSWTGNSKHEKFDTNMGVEEISCYSPPTSPASLWCSSQS